MTRPVDPVAALAAALLPGRAAALLSRRLDGGDAALAGAPRADRLAALAASLGEDAREGIASPSRRDAGRTRVRGASVDPEAEARGVAGAAAAWPVLAGEDVLPFPLPSVAPGLLLVDPGLVALAERAARSAEAGIASVLGGEVTLRGRLLPGLPEAGGAALFPIELTALADRASLAVDRSFAARVAERVAGGSGGSRRAPELLPAARAVVELAVLGALDAISAETRIEEALAPRLGTRGGPPVGGACVELTITAVGISGRALLHLPGAALRALPRMDLPPAGPRDLAVPASLRSGQVTLPRSELEAAAPGDVLVLDDGGDSAHLLLPGGAALAGRLEEGSLTVERVEAGGVAVPAGAAPVTVEVELATVAIPLRELARVAPGAVLPLGIDRRGRVALRVAGERVAEGELVDVDGAVGVRILSLPGAP